jgi:hypothetical protein
MLNWFGANVVGDIYLVNLVCAVIFAYGLIAFARTSPRPWLSVCVAVPYLVIVVTMGYTRQGVAIGLAMLALAALDRGSVLGFGFFIVVASLFHVASYQVDEGDLLAMLETASSHLNSSGLLIFDFWYGPAVLSQRPGVRLKKLKNDQIELSRIAQPSLYENKNIVEVNYDVYVKDVVSGEIRVINETHVMRYLFLPEVERLLSLKGFEMVQVEEWMTSRQPSVDTWGICVVARKK